MSDPAVIPVPATPVPEWRQYLRFAWNAFSQSVEGGWKFYVWMTLLTAVFLVGANAWAVQVRDGMALTAMSDHVSWGLYIANFTFLVGLAAGGVMMVIPAYLYHDEQMHDIVIIGELLAIAAIIMSIMFVVCDLGRPDRFWHMMPGLGKFNFPVSMLTWDVIVLNGYFAINVYICGYLLYKRFRAQQPVAKMYMPAVFLSIVWAISIHTVTAFLYCGLGGRPFWNTALLAPRFLASAFVSGPAFIIVAIQIIRWQTGYTQKQLEKQIDKAASFEAFFAEAPKPNPARALITGVVCGVRVEEVDDPLMREIRYMDKLIDELAKGKAMEKILRG